MNNSASKPAITKPGIPIVIIHQGLYPSVYWALKQAQSSNPNSEIILISEAIQGDVAGIRYESIFDYAGEADGLLGGYVHMSNYSRDFEIVCFKRWFILNAFMRAHNIERIFYIDSDVLLFSDVSEIQGFYSDCDLTLASGKNGECAHASYFNSRQIVEELCNKILLMFEIFQSEKLLLAGREIVQNELISFLGLTNAYFPLNDMRALTLLKRDTRFLVQNSCEIINGGTFDYAMEDRQSGFDKEAEFKRFSWEDGKPFCFHTRLKKAVQFHAIHYQGGIRGTMKRDFCISQKIGVDSIPDCTVQSLATR